MLLWIALFSTLAALISSAVQLSLEYRHEYALLEQRLDQIGPSTEASLTANLWNLDTEQIRLQLQGILLLPDIRLAEVQVAGMNEPLSVSRNLGNEPALFRDFIITHPSNSGTAVLGKLHVEASLSGVYQNMAHMAVEYLFTQSVQIFLVSFCILLLVHELVTRHLIEFARYLRNYDPLITATDLKLQRRTPSEPDELELMVQSFNETSRALYTVNYELAGANEALERDIAQRLAYEDQLERKAHYDDLTGLANRALITDRLQQAIGAAHRSENLCAVVLLDIDFFKSINDARGPDAGDRLLQEFARRLDTCHRPEDSAARMGGDEFMILLPSIRKPHAVQRVLDRVHDAIAPGFELDGRRHHLTLSVGVAIYPNDGSSAAELIGNAESAMFQAKEQGRNQCQYFTSEINERVQRRLKLESRLRGAAGRGELVLHYQPIYSRPGQPPAAFEALVRWRQEDGSLELPAFFIPLAEEVGLINEVGAWVMEQACRDAAVLYHAYPTRPRICVNVSPVQLRDPGFAEWTMTCLKKSGLPAHQLEVEITEGVIVDERSEVAANLVQLGCGGVRLAIDDFGTGYSALGYLQRYPFVTLKVDRIFVSKLDHNPATGRLVEAILNMAHSLDMETIAEGIETESQRDYLNNHGCKLFQGFLLGRPAPLELHLQQLEEMAKLERVPA